MIPQYLKIKGLYSYKHQQEIDFNNLTSAALFGIFGSVGSGKSSILEAIMFALYGDTERLNKSGDERYYNMTNLSSDDLMIDFTCLAGKEDTRYRFVVQGRRNSRNFRDVKVERKVYQWMDDNWSPIMTEDVAEKVIGLNYENFRRTVIIPQGNFQEFIELKGRERSEMMKVLFGLEKFDLAEKNKRLAERNILALESIHGQLMNLGEATPEMIAQKEHELKLTKELIREVEAALVQQRNEEKQQDELLKLFTNLNHTTQKLDLLQEKQNWFKMREEKLKLYEQCVLNFKSLFEQKQAREKEHQQVKTEIARNQALLEQSQVRLQNMVSELEKVRPYYDKRDEYQLKSQELKRLKDLKKLEQESASLQDRIRNGAVVLKEKEALIQHLLNEKQLQEKQLEQRKADLITQQTEHKLQDELVHLQVQKSLQKFADALKDNEPCPLCGSVHHPAILSSDEDFDTKIKALMAKKDGIRTELEQAEKHIKQLGKTIDDHTQEKTEKFEKALARFTEQMAGFDAQKQLLLGQLQVFRWEDFAEKSIEEIDEQQRKTDNDYRKIVETFTRLDKDHRELEGSIKTTQGSQQTLLSSLNAHTHALAQMQQEIDAQLGKVGFGTEEEVWNVLRQNLVIETERNEIQAYQTDLQATRQMLEQLTKDAASKVYEPEKHALLKEGIKANETRFNGLKKEEGSLENEIQKGKENLKSKERLLQEKQRLEIRKDNLETLQKLFKANGFVDFVSSIYLKNLSNAANERFHRMTRHQLHLEVNADNDFEVRDLLNGGKTRLLKTLSGGQKFQAALSLALALADNIHNRVQSRHNFFFLDEGFGSLDRDSLQIVFETLKSLRKENRIVGIISHVDELQQEIQTFLKIENTDEGSRVFTSWQ